MASKEAAKTDETKVDAPSIFAFEFKLSKDKIGEKTTNPQVKSKTQEAFQGYGAFDSCRVGGEVGNDREVTIFFARLFAKGQPAWDSLKKNEKVTIKIYDDDVDIRLSDSKPSGGGATTGTANRPKKEAPKGAKAGPKKEGGRGRGRDGEKPAPGAAGAPGAAADAKDGEGKDGGRGRGRGRGGPKKEEKKESFQRGRANVGGKLGPVSKVRLARQAKEARDKENAARLARGEAPIEDKKKGDDDVDPNAPPPKKGGDKGGKADAKKEGGKGGAKGEAKKEAAKAPAKKK